MWYIFWNKMILCFDWCLEWMSKEGHPAGGFGNIFKRNGRSAGEVAVCIAKRAE